MRFKAGSERVELRGDFASASIAKEVGVPYNVEGMKTDAMRTVILDHASRRRYVPGLVQFFARGDTPPEGIAELIEPVAQTA